MTVEFTAHNIRLDDGECTRPAVGLEMSEYPWFRSARRVLDVVFPGDKSRFRLGDLGCLEGGYAVEFARLGFQTLGVEVRESNVAACRYVKDRTHLPNLEFVRDDVWNVARHGPFDAVFCCGLFYHLDRPRQFIDLLSSVTRRVVILQTHFAAEHANPAFGLSELTEHEGMRGRWWTEFADQAAFANREHAKWASWENDRSFWLTRECLLQGLQAAGFDLVAEQFDSLGPDIAAAMTTGYYHTEHRGTFVGIKTGVR